MITSRVNNRGQTPPPADKAMQWQDMPPEARQHLSGQVRAMGMGASSVETQRGRLQRTEANAGNPRTAAKAQQRQTSLTALTPHLQDKPITHAGAANRRVNLTMQGAERSRTEGTDSGQGWYFNHHRRLAEVAATSGIDKTRVIAASAVMSPQNNPEQELTAVRALATAHTDRYARVRVPGDMSEHPVLGGLAGESIHPRHLSPEHIAALSEPAIRAKVGTTRFDLEAVAKGGVKGNVVKAVNVLRGNTPVEKAIDPRTSPKVWSYHAGIAMSEHGSPEHTEFMERMHVATGGELPGQQRMDVMGLRGATHGPLNPAAPTAEDTWQQAISTGQSLPAVPIPGRQGRAAMQSPAKFSVGEGGAANQKYLRAVPGVAGAEPSALMHSWQNEATQRAARTLSRRSGEIVPAIGVQAGGWTEARRQAGKAIEEQPRKITQRKGPQQMSFAI
jgi:hypothetical protein